MLKSEFDFATSFIASQVQPDLFVRSGSIMLSYTMNTGWCEHMNTSSKYSMPLYVIVTLVVVVIVLLQ